jgi:hypothetical protein
MLHCGMSFPRNMLHLRHVVSAQHVAFAACRFRATTRASLECVGADRSV